MSYSRGVEPVVYEPGGSHVSSTSPKNVARLNGWAGILRDCVADGLIPVAAAGNDGNEAVRLMNYQLIQLGRNLLIYAACSSISTVVRIYEELGR